MIRHIVMFKLKAFETAKEKQEALQELISWLNELPEKINLIKKYEAGTNINTLDWAYDIVLTMDFNSMQDLENYNHHQAHQAFVSFNKAFTVSKVCIDYPIA